MAKADAPNELAQAVARLARLKRAYERYWAGLERPEPASERDALRAQFVELRKAADAQANTAVAFRARSAQASFLAFDELCTRRAHEEEGLGPAPRRRPGGAGVASVVAANEANGANAAFAGATTATTTTTTTKTATATATAAAAATTATSATATAGESESRQPGAPAGGARPAGEVAEISSLYAELTRALAARQQAAPSQAAFAAMVASRLAAAQAQAPGAVLAPELRLQPDGRIQLAFLRKDS